MSPRLVALWCVLPSFAALLEGQSPSPSGPAEVRFTVATLHAAALTAPRSPDDSLDSPYLLISIAGPGANETMVHVPTTGHLRIRLDQALYPAPLLDFRLQPGDSVRLLVSVLEGVQPRPSEETKAALASAKALAHSLARRDSVLASALAPMTKQGEHWLGSATLLLTNEGGTTYWRALECVATCKVLTPPTRAALAGKDAPPMAGVVELHGGGGTYHLQLVGKRKS